MGPFIGSYDSKYHYKASKNGCRIYYEYVEPTAWSSGYYDEDDYMMVSSDRSVVNWHFVSVIDGHEEIYVFHRANKSDEIQDLIY